jgi:hypothetical protein
MIDDATAAVLQEIVRRESQSLLQYLSDAYPWVNGTQRATLGRLQSIIATERQALGDLVKLLQREHRALPPLGQYPSSFTTMNFVSLQHVVPLLIKAQRQSVADLENDLPKIHNDNATTTLRHLLDTKKSHLSDLESLTAQPQLALS